MLHKSAKYGIPVYFVLVCIVLIANLIQNQTLEFVVKPMLMPALIFIVLNHRYNLSYRRWIVAALFFSWVGDILLMFQSDGSMFFMVGLLAFLVAHLSYIRFFGKLISASPQFIKNKAVFIILVMLYCASLYYFLYRGLGSLWLPVLLYAVVISIMLLLSFNIYYSINRNAAICFIIGALLFVISDSLLAIQKFRTPIPYAGFLIMLSYCLAQFYIVKAFLIMKRMH